MRDRLLRGGLAGVIGTIWLLPWNLFSHYILHFAKTTWLDAMANLELGHPIKNAMDYVAAIGLLLLWNGILGGIYVRFIVTKQEGNYIGRGIAFGLASWFILEAFGSFYRIPSLDKIAWQTAFSNWFGVSGFGLILGWLTKRWDEHEAGNRKT